MLDVGAGVIRRLADNREDFLAQIAILENANNWLMIPLVDQCIEAGLTLSESQCYGYKIPPMLGGQYIVDNVEPTDLSVHYWMLTNIFRQTKDLPEGAKIDAVLIDQS